MGTRILSEHVRPCGQKQPQLCCDKGLIGASNLSHCGMLDEDAFASVEWGRAGRRARAVEQDSVLPLHFSLCALHSAKNLRRCIVEARNTAKDACKLSLQKASPLLSL